MFIIESRFVDNGWQMVGYCHSRWEAKAVMKAAIRDLQKDDPLIFKGTDFRIVKLITQESSQCTERVLREEGS